jgi:CheY-like chemotaxis protein
MHSTLRVASRRPAAGKGKAAAPGREGLGARPTMTVLIVDDVVDTRDMYERYFEFQQTRVITAADGVAALRAVRSEHPDVIVLDLAMPVLTGWDVIRHLKSHAATRSIPIVAVSGHHAEESAMLEGADSYCEKPCAPEALFREVMRVLREPFPKRGR